MLAPLIQSQYVTKVVTSKSGELFRVVFAVSLIDGETQVRVISAQPLSQSNEVPVCLPSPFVLESAPFTYTPHFSSVISPFNEFSFFTSQLTRAPSIV